MVLRAGAGSLGALDDLCGDYWFPIYAYLRRRGLSAEDAAEQSQEFFAGLLKRGDLGRVKRDGRRFRAWLFTAVSHQYANHRRSESAQRRQRIEVDDAEARFAAQVAPGLDPEQVFARQWALAVLSSARDRVRSSYEARGQAEVFAVLGPVLVGENAPYGELAAVLGITEGAVKVAVHRLRTRFGRALREEVAETLDGPEEIEAELKILLEALGGR